MIPAPPPCPQRLGAIPIRAVHRLVPALLPVLLLAALAACGGDDATAPAADGSDTTAPTVTGTSPGDAPILRTDSLTITFSERMEPQSLALSGSMAADSPAATWSDGADADDTLTLAAAGGWTAGHGRTLVIDATDHADNPLATVTLTFSIFEGFVYVHPSGNPGATGTRSDPFDTLGEAITAADAGYTTAAVLVAAGTYTVDSSSGTLSHVQLAEGISLYGGYSATDWSVRDVAAHETSIVDSGTDSLLTSDPNRALEAAAGVTGETVVDGFTITGASGGSYSAGVFVDAASPTVRHCTINGGAGSNKSYGVYTNNAEPTLSDNTIDGGTGGSESYGLYLFSNASHAPVVSGNDIDGGVSTITRGVYMNFGAAVVRGNTIYGGSAASGSSGILDSNGAATIAGNDIDGGITSSTGVTTGITVTLASATPMIVNNTIFGGSPSGSYSAGVQVENGGNPTVLHNTISGGTSTSPAANGIQIVGSGSTATVRNNIIFTDTPTGSHCLIEAVGVNFTAVDNNALFDCDKALFRDDNDGDVTDTATPISLSGGSGTLASFGNVAVDAVLQDAAGGDYHLTAASPAGVTAGGLDLTVAVPEDKDGNPRTVPVSMGAYERD